MLTDEPDEILVRRFYDGDRRAYEVLWRRYFDRITAWLTRRRPIPINGVGADDLALNTLYKFARTRTHGGRYDPAKGSFVSWIYTIAYHALLEQIEKDKRTPSMIDIQEVQGKITNLEFNWGDYKAETEELLKQFELAARNCVRVLEECHREVLRLKAEQLPLKTIGRIMEISTTQAWRLLEEARAEVHLCVERDGFMVLVIDKKTFRVFRRP